MFKISWGLSSDKFRRYFILVPDANTLFSAYHVLTGYGKDDGMTPVDLKVTNLNGDLIDMTKGLHVAASNGTYSGSLC